MISRNLMLDPSLFIDRQVGRRMERQGAIDKLGRQSRELSFLDFYIPETFETAVFDDDKEVAWDGITEFFGPQGDFPDRDILQHKLQNYVTYNTYSLSTPHSDDEDQLQDDIHELNENRYSDERDRILADLDLGSGETEIVAQILIEELAFGLEMSPVFSRLKKTFQKMSSAAQVVVEPSEQYTHRTANHIIDVLENKLPGYRRELTPLEALEVACKYKKMDIEMTTHKLALYREALKDEIPLTNWIAAPASFYIPYTYSESGAFSGNFLSDMPALLSGGITLVLLDP